MIRIATTVLLLSGGAVFADNDRLCAPDDKTCKEDPVDRTALLDKVGALEVLVVGPGTEGPEFELSDHRQMIRELDGLAATCTDRLLSAQWRQDLFHQNDNPAHFDNCALDDGMKRILSHVGDAEKTTRAMSAATVKQKKRMAASALLSLGRALHALQDFFSHSNFVELQDARLGDVPLKDVALPQFWTEDGAKSVRQLAAEGGFHSGTWPFGDHACKGEPRESHGALAKDSPGTARGKMPLKLHGTWGNSHYVVARKLAVRASRAFIKNAFPQPLIEYCGATLGLLVMVDERVPEPQ